MAWKAWPGHGLAPLRHWCLVAVLEAWTFTVRIRCTDRTVKHAKKFEPAATVRLVLPVPVARVGCGTMATTTTTTSKEEVTMDEEGLETAESENAPFPKCLRSLLHSNNCPTPKAHRFELSPHFRWFLPRWSICSGRPMDGTVAPKWTERPLRAPVESIAPYHGNTNCPPKRRTFLEKRVAPFRD